MFVFAFNYLDINTQPYCHFVQ